MCARNVSKPQDGTRAPDPFIDPATAGGFGGGGRHHKSASKFVYRGGFKIPKELTPMPSIESLPEEFGGAASSVVVSSNGGFQRDADTFRDTGVGGSGSKLRDPGSTRRTVGDPGAARGLEGIISGSRMMVGSSSERGGGSRRDGIKMPRPKTAGATVGRGGSVLSVGSVEGACF